MVLLIPVLEADPYELDALALLGCALIDDGRADRGSEAFVRLLKFDPDRAEAHFHLRQEWAQLRRYPEAVQEWERVMQLQPAGELAQQARRNARSARDLQHIFAQRKA